jgi:hypothetical protein
MSTAIDSESTREKRDKRIAQLEARVSLPPIGVKWPVALVAIVLASGLLWMQRNDVRYFFSSRAPLSLGAEGEYRFDHLQSNRYAEIHGTPTLRGAYSVERGTTYVVIGLRHTPILVRRAALPGEEWTGPTPPHPDQRPFAVRGRLLSQEDAKRYQDGFVKLLSMGETKPLDGKLWILIEGEAPMRDLPTFFWMVGLALFALVNLYFIAQSIRRRFASV